MSPVHLLIEMTSLKEICNAMNLVYRIEERKTLCMAATVVVMAMAAMVTTTMTTMFISLQIMSAKCFVDDK